MNVTLAAADPTMVGDPAVFAGTLARSRVRLFDRAPIALHVCPARDFRPVPGAVNVLWTTIDHAPLGPPELDAISSAGGLLVTGQFAAELVKARAIGQVHFATVRLGFDPRTFPTSGRLTDPDDGPLRVIWESAPGRATPEGLQAIGEAWSSTLAHDPEARLYVLKPEAEGDGSIAVKGPVTIDTRKLSPAQRAALYRSQHAMVVTSSASTSGRIQLEAAATGLPVIALSRHPETDFFDEGTTTPLSYDIEWDSSGGESVARSWVVARVLRGLRSEYPAHLRRARAASARAHARWTWTNVFTDLLAWLYRFHRFARPLRIAA